MKKECSNEGSIQERSKNRLLHTSIKFSHMKRSFFLIRAQESACVLSFAARKEVMIIMRTKRTSLLSAVQVLSLGFFCGLIFSPLGSLLLRSLVLYLREKRKASMPPVTYNPLVRTERGMVIQVIPQSLAENKREETRLAVKAR